MERRKLALVTGGSRGIGRAICARLAESGMDVVFNYNSNEADAEETMRICREKGVNASAVKADISNPKQCMELVEKALEAGGGYIDVLVNNAGITKDTLIMKMTDEMFDDVIDVNLKGTFMMMRNVSKIMLKQRSGRIINISSIVGVRGNAGQVNYAASKAGIIGMTKSLAKELASRHITVNAVAPGMIDTEMTRSLGDSVREKMIAQIPFGQPGKAEDVANAVAFLAGDESGYITGQVICVDGGMAV
ncbi:MAG: 3-oxoacyl-[acyl-carrier-protein] reductase [Butyrivibrio sp.]